MTSRKYINIVRTKIFVFQIAYDFKSTLHFHAHDVQLYVSGKLSIAVGLVNRTLQAIGVNQTWMSPNRLCLNPDKTQFIWRSTSQQLAKRDVQHLPLCT